MAVFIVKDDSGEFTHDGWPCQRHLMEEMIERGDFVPVSVEEYQSRIDRMVEDARKSNAPIAYMPIARPQ